LVEVVSSIPDDATKILKFFESLEGMFRTFEDPDDLRAKLLPFLSTKAKSLISRLATVKAKFHYTSWFGAGSELIRS